jgi:hypothetical protein
VGFIRRTLPCFLALLGVVGSARPLYAYCRTTVCGKDCDMDPVTLCPTGTPIVWPQLCVSYSMQYQASKKVDIGTASEIARKAFGAWQNVECPQGGAPSIAVGDQFGPVACDVHEYNQVDGNANIILFHDDEWPYANSVDILALTTVTFSKKTGDVYDVDMEINAKVQLSTTDVVDPEGYDLQSIMTHEAGHFLGLGHSIDPLATMYAQYSAGTDGLRDLSDDDIAGICTVYPPTGAQNVCDYAPRQGFSPECGIFPAGNGTCSITAGSFGSRSAPGAAVGLWAGVAATLVARLRRASALRTRSGIGKRRR